MPFVHIVMEPRDEESKHRIAREVVDAVAEGTNNSIDGINVIFHEVPRPGYAKGLSLASRRPRRNEAPVRPEHVSISRLHVRDEPAYLELRRDRINPSLAAQPGFVSTMLLRAGGGEHWVIEKWMSEADARAWHESAACQELQRIAAAGGTQAVDERGAVLLHQQFGPNGGRVVDGSAAQAQPAGAAS